MVCRALRFVKVARRRVTDNTIFCVTGCRFTVTVRRVGFFLLVAVCFWPGARAPLRAALTLLFDFSTFFSIVFFSRNRDSQDFDKPRFTFRYFHGWIVFKNRVRRLLFARTGVDRRVGITASVTDKGLGLRKF